MVSRIPEMKEKSIYNNHLLQNIPPHIFLVENLSIFFIEDNVKARVIGGPNQVCVKECESKRRGKAPNYLFPRYMIRAEFYST